MNDIQVVPKKTPRRKVSYVKEVDFSDIEPEKALEHFFDGLRSPNRKTNKHELEP